MTTTSPTQSTDHMIQICRERSARGVATRADWQRLHEINPERAVRELRTFLQRNNTVEAANPFEQRPPRSGLALGFVAGVVVMSLWWLFGAYLHANVVSTGPQWNMVTLSQYIAASLIPFFAWMGWRIDQRKHAERTEQPQSENLRDADWEQLLARFDATRKAGGTRMY